MSRTWSERAYDGVCDLATGRPLEPPSHDDDRVLVIADSSPGPLLLVKECIAYCKKIEGPKEFSLYGKRKLIFHFEVIEPNEHAGVVLRSFVTCEEAWLKAYVPRSSTLYRYISCALGREPKQRDRITKTLWKGHVFKCKVKDSRTKDGKLHSVIEGLINKHA